MKNVLLKNKIKLLLLVIFSFLILSMIFLTSCSLLNATVDTDTFPNKVAESAKINGDTDNTQSISDDIVSEYKKMLDFYIADPSQNPTMVWYLKTRLTQLGVSCATLGTTTDCCYFDLPATSGYQDTPKLLLTGNIGEFSYNGYGTLSDLAYEYDDSTGQFVSTGKENINGSGGLVLATAISLAKSNTIQHGPIRVLLYNSIVKVNKSSEIRKAIEEYDYAIDLGSTNHVGTIATKYPESDSGSLPYTLQKENNPSGYSSLSVSLNNLEKGNFATLKSDKHISAFEILQKISASLEEKQIDFRFAEIQMKNENYLEDLSLYPDSLNLSIAVPSNLLGQTKDCLKDIESSVLAGYNEPNFSISVADSSTSLCYTQNLNVAIKQLLQDAKYGITNNGANNSNFLNMTGIKQDSSNITFSLSYGYYSLYSDVYSSSNIDITNYSNVDSMVGSQSDTSISYYTTNGIGLNAKYSIDTSNTLYNMVKNAFVDSAGINSVDTTDIEYSLIGQLYQVNPSLSAVGLGFDVQNQGLNNEVVYVKSLPAYTAALAKIFSEMQTVVNNSNDTTHQLTAQVKTAYGNYLAQTKFPGTEYKFINLCEELPPAIVCNGTYASDGGLVLQYYNGEVKMQQTRRLVCDYIEGKGIILNSGGNMDYYFDYVYKFENGQFNQIGAGTYEVTWSGANSSTTYNWDGNTVDGQTYIKNRNVLCDKYKLLYPLKNYWNYYSKNNASDGFEVYCKTDLLSFLNGA